MTRNALFTHSISLRRLRGLSVLLTMAIVSSTFGWAQLPTASAQSSDIQQVAGRSGNSNYSRSGGLLSGLFGRRSKSKEPYRHATPVPSDRDVNWNGIPYHSPEGGRSAGNQAAPIRDPGARSRQAAQSNAAPARRADGSRNQRSSLPSPPPIADTTPRKLSTTSESKTSSSQMSSNRPEPLSVTQSSRRPVKVGRSDSQPTRVQSSEPALVKKSPSRRIRSDETGSELVPKVSRKVIASAPPAKAPAAKKSVSTAKKSASTPAKESVSTVKKSASAPAKESVAASEETSSRRAKLLPKGIPTKLESGKAEAPQVARREIKTPSVKEEPKSTPAPAAPAAPKTRVAESSPKSKPARKSAAAEPALAAPASTPDAKTRVAASKPAPKSPVATEPNAAAQPTPTSEMSQMPLGDARQSTSTSAAKSDSNNAPASLGLPSESSDQIAANANGMSLPTGTNLHSSSSRTQDSDGKSTAKSAEFNRMNTLGNNQDDGRSSGALASTGMGSVALKPISDRLPVDDQNDSPDAMQAEHNSQYMSHNDTFIPRVKPTPGPIPPNHQMTGFGRDLGNARESRYDQGSQVHQGENSNSQSSAPKENAGSHPNTMRSQDGAASQPGPNNSVSSPAGNRAAGADTHSSTTTTELPIIRVITAGPRQVMIRQTHPYEIRVENRGSVDAEGLIVRAHVPDWADVVGQQVSRGDVQAAMKQEVRNLNWKIDRLPAGETETMLVRLKAARSGTHDLDVDYTIAPQKRVVQVTVQEPQLALTIDGPDEVIYGESKTYQIRVLNPGDGIAPEVVFTLSPESSSPQSQRIGDIPAGKEAQFEVELSAQDLGELKIHGIAVGDLELKTEADKTVRVLAADLEAVLSGPEVKYQDTLAVYQLELANHGTTASENVVANLLLPMGVTYQGGMEGATMIDNQLRWKVASLTPGAVRKYQFQCQMDATGTHEFAFDCKGSAAGQTSVSLDTNVEAIADLVLSIDDPNAPAPIGEDVEYEIVIRNRGSKPAHDVQAVAQFSHGIEPKQISGHMGKVITGQVLIDPIPRIDAGEEVRMTIAAQAETGGHHRFRTEVRSGDTVLVAEEATHYLPQQNERVTRRSGPGGNEFAVPMR